MKRIGIMICNALFLFSIGLSQEIIENEAKPLSPDAGRIVTLKEEMRIEDTGEGFYFKNPFTIRVSPKGDIFIHDGQEQALQFEPNGRFVRNLFKKGQGPGELSGLRDIWASSERLYLTGFPPKILVFNYDGSLDQEISSHDIEMMSRFIWAGKNSILISKPGRPDPAAGGGIRDVPQEILEISTNSGIAKVVGSFSIRTFVQIYEGGFVGTTTWNQLNAVAFNEKTIILNYTPEYFLEIFSRDKEAVVRRFRRPYARVKRTGGGGIISSGGSGPAPPEFQTDIYSIHVIDGKIWIQTSTIEKGKGILFDVFDPEGHYVDSFYLQPPTKTTSGRLGNMRLAIVDGFAYFRERTDNNLIVIKKCRIVGY
jgi:hypothetical protein